MASLARSYSGSSSFEEANEYGAKVDEFVPGTKSTELSTIVVPSEPVSVKVGMWYPFMYQSAITECRPEKIYQDPTSGETYLVLTVVVKASTSKWVKTEITSTITLSEFKLRLMKGGINEIVI